MVQSGPAALFGGCGRWERSAILNRVFTVDGQALWDTTARFHIWPWPFKFAVVTNTPAFLCWALVNWPLGGRWPRAPEAAIAAPSLLFVALLWYAVSGWIDKRWGSTPQVVWGSLLGFTLICAAGVSVPSTTFYLLWGVFLWLIVGCRIAFGTRHRALQPHGDSAGRADCRIRPQRSKPLTSDIAISASWLSHPARSKLCGAATAPDRLRPRSKHSFRHVYPWKQYGKACKGSVFFCNQPNALFVVLMTKLARVDKELALLVGEKEHSIWCTATACK
jgi:hypothetical protein